MSACACQRGIQGHFCFTVAELAEAMGVDERTIVDSGAPVQSCGRVPMPRSRVETPAPLELPPWKEAA
jgi:hypothetical protein